MKAYLDTLKQNSSELGIDLLEAFKTAMVPTSTYYRTINGQTELRYETALKVSNAIDRIHEIQQAREHSERLRKVGKNANPRKIKSRFKPRKTSVQHWMHSFVDSQMGIT